MKPLEVTYELTIEDALAFLDDAGARSPAIRRQTTIEIVLGLIAGLGGAALGLWVTGYWPPDDPVSLVAVALWVVVMVALLPGWLRRQRRRRLRRILKEGTQAASGPEVLRIAPDTIVGANDLGASKVDWKAITEVHQTDTYLFLHLSSLTAIIIPARAFPDRETFDQFAQAARDFHARANPGMTPNPAG